MKMQHFTAAHSGQKRKVLFEGSTKNGMMEGYTDNYIRISTLYKSEWANQVVEWIV
jgi:threonylcarbamoyladenosine tRNA methylthiotransferase MtaB